MKLLVTGALNCTGEQLDILRDIGYEIIFMQNESDELPDGAENVEGVICNGLFLHHNIEQFEKLRFIQLTSAGYDRVPMEYIIEKGIKIFNARGVYSIPMAEFALSGVLQLYKNARFFYENQKKCRWEKNRQLLELYGKNVCIVGCGSVGNECAKRFSSFGCSVTGVDVTPYDCKFYEKMVTLSELDTVLEEADIVVLTLPLTEETAGLFDENRFWKMKQGAVLVNISRGAVVCEKALIKALNDNLFGAVLDVFESEPLDTTSPLWNMENVIVTPHNSFVGEGNGGRLFNVICENLKGVSFI